MSSIKAFPVYLSMSLQKAFYRPFFLSKSQQAPGRPPKINHYANSKTSRGYMYKVLKQLSISASIYMRPKPPAATAITDEKRQAREVHL